MRGGQDLKIAHYPPWRAAIYCSCFAPASATNQLPPTSCHLPRALCNFHSLGAARARPPLPPAGSRGGKRTTKQIIGEKRGDDLMSRQIQRTSPPAAPAPATSHHQHPPQALRHQRPLERAFWREDPGSVHTCLSPPSLVNY